MGYKLRDDWEVFGRYEWIDAEPQEVFQFVTVGINHYFDHHRSKLTIDLVVLFDGEPTDGDLYNPFFRAGSVDDAGNATGPGIGFTGPGDANQKPNFLFRIQYQLVF